MDSSVSDLNSLWIGEIQKISCKGLDYILVRTENTISAFRDQCPHLGVPLSQGHLSEHTLTCSAHGWEFDAITGKGVNPASSCLKRIPTKIIGSQIFLLSEDEKKNEKK